MTFSLPMNWSAAGNQWTAAVWRPMPRLRSAIDVRATDVRNGSAGSAQYSGEAAIEAPVIPNKQVADLEKAAACST
jgi:hypothetical protein